MKDLEPRIDDTIIFTSTSFDKGSGYDNTTGIYTAPASGLFMFTCQLCVEANKFVNIVLAQGKTRVNNMYTDGGKIAGACRKMVDVLMLAKGDEVRIAVYGKEDGRVFWESGRSTNIFTGILISVL